MTNKAWHRNLFTYCTKSRGNYYEYITLMEYDDVAVLYKNTSKGQQRQIKSIHLSQLSKLIEYAVMYARNEHRKNKGNPKRFKYD